jgi:protein-L-isoaspartate(D-aspartate) O-methyltransferase
MVAIMLEVSDLKPGIKVLEIGCGSGYNVALIAEIVGEEHVTTIERIPELAKWGQKNLKSAGYNINVVIQDGTKGYPEKALYDRIISTAAPPKIPDSWVEQVKVGGLIVSPVGPKWWYQELEVGKKMEDGSLDIIYHGEVSFVPLVGEEGHNP